MLSSRIHLSRHGSVTIGGGGGAGNFAPPVEPPPSLSVARASQASPSTRSTLDSAKALIARARALNSSSPFAVARAAGRAAASAPSPAAASPARAFELEDRAPAAESTALPVVPDPSMQALTEYTRVQEEVPAAIAEDGVVAAQLDELAADVDRIRALLVDEEAKVRRFEAIESELARRSAALDARDGGTSSALALSGGSGGDAALRGRVEQLSALLATEQRHHRAEVESVQALRAQLDEATRVGRAATRSLKQCEAEAEAVRSERDAETAALRSELNAERSARKALEASASGAAAGQWHVNRHGSVSNF